ncbi:protein regulator of cytokinesis 1-like isoform X2 [Conger conger]|uniref:protein regulator of cytokinesis 1-like isoform X2 n=1 Tax=Conger conger TaxID=82655 RepID=UPI002A5990C8|nr:protein regulator of cytokinesis 1-like isoform X2 [Conger conger]
MRRSEVLSAESVACLNTALGCLKNIWEEIGIPEDQRIQRTEAVKNYIKGLLDMMILEEENLRKSLRSSIEKSRKELDTLCRELQLSPFKEDSGTMLQVDKDLRVRVEALMKQKSQRMQELKDLREQDQDLCDILCTDSFSLIPDAHTVPSLQQLQHFRQHLASLAAEKERRRSVFVGLKKQIILCMEDLEQLPDTSFERDVVHEDEDAFCLSEENIASLRLLLSTLEKRKAETAERCGVCRGRIRELWDRLELCQEERDALHQHMASSKKRNLEALQAELSRLEEMKLGRIRDLIKGIRLEMASYWDLCFLSAEEQQAFIPYCSDDFTEELLAVHRAELQQLKQRYEAHRELFDSVRGWEDSWKLFLELEKKATDPSRFNNRGGNLLKEEKQRTDLLKSLTKLEKKLKVQMEAWTEQEGQEFLVRGHNFLQFVEAHWERHRTEKEREKLERHLKKSRQTEEDMLYGTVKRTPSKHKLPGNNTPGKTRKLNGTCSTLRSALGTLCLSPGPRPALTASKALFARTPGRPGRPRAGLPEQNKENVSNPNRKDVGAASGSPATPQRNRDLSKVSRSPCNMGALNSTALTPVHWEEKRAERPPMSGF